MCNAEQARADALDMIECLKKEWSSKEQEFQDQNVQAKEEVFRLAINYLESLIFDAMLPAFIGILVLECAAQESNFGTRGGFSYRENREDGTGRRGV